MIDKHIRAGVARLLRAVSIWSFGKPQPRKLRSRRSLALAGALLGAVVVSNSVSADVAVTFSYDANGNRLSETGATIALSAKINPPSVTAETVMPAAGGTVTQSSVLTAMPMSGQPPYSYSWSQVTGSGPTFTISGGTTSQATVGSSCSASPLTGCTNTGTFQVTVTDSASPTPATVTTTAAVAHRFLDENPTVSISGPNVTELMSATGSRSQSSAVTATITGGTPPFSYSWSYPQGTFSGSGTGSPLTLTSSCSNNTSGCTDSGTISLTVTDGSDRQRQVSATPITVQHVYNPAPTVTASSNGSLQQLTMPPTTALQSLQSTLTATTSGGQPPFSYVWTQTSGPTFGVVSQSGNTYVVSSSCNAPITGCEAIGVFQVVATDATGGKTAASSVTIEHLYNSAPPLGVTASVNGTLQEMTMPASTAEQDLGSDLTATVTNAQGTIQYQWTQVSSPALTFTTATTANPAGVISLCSNASSGCVFSNIQFEVTATDPIGRTATSAPVTFSHIFLQAPPPTVTVSPTSINLTSNTSGGGGTIRQSATATPSGGLAPYTYSWTVFSGTTAALSSTTAATVSFSATCGTNQNCIHNGVELVTVTDALGHPGTAQVPVSVDMEGNR